MVFFVNIGITELFGDRCIGLDYVFIAKQSTTQRVHCLFDFIITLLNSQLKRQEAKRSTC